MSWAAPETLATNPASAAEVTASTITKAALGTIQRNRRCISGSPIHAETRHAYHESSVAGHPTEIGLPVKQDKMVVSSELEKIL